MRRVPVAGGDLTVGEWGPEDPGVPVVLALHGITAHHRCWPLVAAGLPGVRVVAPDLRGRGRSGDLPGPYGLDQHAEDLERLLDELGVDPSVVVGHSMGGFVAVRLAGRLGARVRALVLVDGGIALVVPPGYEPDPDAGPVDVLGPAGARLTMTFTSVEEYRDFWRAHPAFAGRWSSLVEAYADYDLRGSAPHLRASASLEAAAADFRELAGNDAHDQSLTRVRDLALPVTFLRAPRGLLDEPRALYPPDVATGFAQVVPQVRAVEVEDVNHYTIVMEPAGASRVTQEVRALLA